MSKPPAKKYKPSRGGPSGRGSSTYDESRQHRSRVQQPTVDELGARLNTCSMGGTEESTYAPSMGQPSMHSNSNRYEPHSTSHPEGSASQPLAYGKSYYGPSSSNYSSGPEEYSSHQQSIGYNPQPSLYGPPDQRRSSNYPPPSDSRSRDHPSGYDNSGYNYTSPYSMNKPQPYYDNPPRAGYLTQEQPQYLPPPASTTFHQPNNPYSDPQPSSHRFNPPEH
ncbi:hypothetical protein B0J14DRAFT_563266 [Halenospora varia]|nr:hypothetical protein B0J14DRAFT_563266 [Halenospora varia]